MASHNANYKMWEEGSVATNGLRDLAEGGFVNTMRTEVLINMNAGNFREGGEQSNNNGEATQMLPAIELNAANPLLSVAQKIQPSSDWFTGEFQFLFVDE